MATEFSRLLSLNVANAVRRGVAAGLVGSHGQLVAFARGMDIGNKNDMKRIHTEIAADVRTAVRGAYDQKVEGQRLTPSYDRFNRRSGFLRRVLQRADLAEGFADGITFVNDAVMDKEAAHWRRLNFGAGAAAGGFGPEFPLRLFGETLGTIGFREGPSAPFALPPGFFIHGITATLPNLEFRGRGSTGAFMPSRKSPYAPAMTEGIRGRHFLEVGLEVISTELRTKYEDQLNRWVNQGGQRAKAVTSVVIVPSGGFFAGGGFGV